MYLLNRGSNLDHLVILALFYSFKVVGNFRKKIVGIPAIYVLQILHGQSSGFNCLILFLKILRDEAFLISLGIIDRIFGPREENTSTIMEFY